MLDRNDLKLYLCIGRDFLKGRPLADVLEAAIAGGVTLVKIREKEICTREFLDLTCAALEITRAHKVPLVINDRLDIVIAAGADGLHVGQSDMPLKTVKRIAEGKFFVGASVRTVEEALTAEKAGADYISVGAMFPTTSKVYVGEPLGLEPLANICAAVNIPVVGIGGINLQNAGGVLQSGAAGIAVISAILSQPDIKTAAENLKALSAK